MAPQRFASARYKSRPVALVPFRDDTSLIAFRYEQTVQAQLPIPIIPVPPRNPSCPSRPFSAVSTGGPVVIAPPVIQPQEQHPALRSRNIKSLAEDWKRDSGLAPTASSVTIREEDEEEYFSAKLAGSDEATSTYTAEVTSFDNSNCPSSRPQTPELRNSADLATSREAASSPTPSSKSSRLARALSFRSSSPTKRLRKKSISEGDEVPPLQSPRGPKSPKFSKPKMSERDRRSSPTSDRDFTPINTNIPTESLLEDDFLTSLTFSKRGSLMFGGKRPFPLAPHPMETPGDAAARRDGAAENAPGTASKILSVPSIQVTSLDVERESQKVRSLYESGDAVNWEDGGRVSSLSERHEPVAEVPSEEEEKVASASSGDHLEPDQASSQPPRSASSSSLRRDNSAKNDFELAGGIEDWEDVDGADVDRYGFIQVKRPQSRPTTANTTSTQQTPGKRKVLVKRRDSAAYTSSPLGPSRAPSRKVSARSLNTQASEVSTASRRSTRSSIRAATNLLPHNRDRRWMDEAGEMLTLAPGLADIAEDEQTGKISEALKKKEWERSEKWRKMAKVVKKGKDGEGMEFEFDVKNPKLVERTWKGIPDRWRSAAWHSFLTTSAKRQRSKVTDEELITEFRRIQSVSSPDDVQIDLDVPRTINRHIMFRKRYRGGQRLLFRVLHAISLYFPDTGYVQGMASLAATLLCYYDEEKCFVMLVRMWQLRGLERLYQPGFGYLMAALQEFEKHWLEGKDVARKLTELSIDPTAYGTRWYLTLFNLSVPFPAQLRIWDVFMLLGDSPSPNPADSTADATQSTESTQRGFDILHATSAALIHALRDVLLGSDFENAMKALTSWVPIKDEELLMKVTRAEWKQHQGKRKA